MIQNDNLGYITVKEAISPFTVKQFKMWAINPANIHRGNAVNGEYYGKHRKDREYNVWWSKEPPREMWQPIVDVLRGYIDTIFQGKEWSIHVVDTITTRPGSAKIRAHIDTPYRFEEYAHKSNDEVFGVQCLIPLDKFTIENGATCILPGSYREKFYYKDIEENQEEYNNLLTTKGFQFVSNPGDVLMYNARTLHSTMPNNSNFYRSALLLNAIDTSILPMVRNVDVSNKTARFDYKQQKT
jgi:ectoine hydroxylase-related dioxygenase (phytanoyl-CoA dioxygenase family)